MPSLRTILLGIASIFLVLLLAAALFLAHAKTRLAGQFEAPGRLVDIGGYRLHLHCLGEGRPTVVLEAGLNEFSLAWAQVQDETAKFARACAYDRAGFGWSERGPLERTGSNMVRELHALLGRSGIEAPVVLVGHSFGGLLAREYVHAYPGEVIGLVLVDAAHEEYLERIPEVLRGVQRGVQDFKRLSWISRLGLMALEPEKIPARGLHGEALARYRAILATTDFFDTAAAETAAFEQNLAAARALPLGPLGALPLAVLSRGQADAQRLLTSEENERNEREWSALQGRLVTLSSRARQVIATRSGHAIQKTEPGLVTDAIRGVIATRP
jgi:pimeloyl-ACP methyl ester carboxylesterase